MARINGSSSKNGYLFYGDFTEVIPADYLTTNKTNLEYKIYIQSQNVRFDSNWWVKRTVINGTTVWAEDNVNIKTNHVNNGVPVCIMSGTLTGIEHNADGTKTVDVSAYISKTQSYTSYDPGYCSLSGQIQLTTIPRTSSVTATDGYINDGSRPVNIHINTATTAFRHTLRYTFGGLSGTIADKYAYLDYGWTLPTSLYTQIPNNTSGVGTIYCDTYNGDTLIGTSSPVNFTARVDEGQNRPTVSSTVVDTNKTLPTGYTTKGLTGSEYKFIKGVSNAQVTISASPKNSASIISYRTVNNSRTYTASSFTIENIEDPKFDVSATDSRGFVGYQSGNPTTVNMINYIPLTVNLNIYRPEPTSGEVILSVSGNYFAKSFGTQNNSLTLQYRYKESSANWDDVAYRTITATIDSTNNKYSVSLSLGTTFDYQKSYDFEVIGTDKVQSIPKTYRVSEGIPMFAMFKDHLEAFGSNIFVNNGNFVGVGSNISVENYSTEEKIIGTWIDGKPLYRKTIDCGSLPIATRKVVPHGISNLKIIADWKGTFYNSSYTQAPIPYIVTESQTIYVNYHVSIEATINNIILYTGIDRSGYNAYITLDYTKTTD